MGLLVRDSFDEPVRVGSVATRGKELGVSEIGLVDSEDDAADSGNGLELVGCGVGPRGAIVGAHIRATLPGPTHAAQYYDALYAARH